MKTWQKYIQIPLISAVFVAVGGVFFLHGASAATGQIYLTPASPSVQNGSTVALDLRINPGQAVNNVEATINYDSTKLTFVSIDTTSSAFSNQFAQSTSTGKITLQRGTDVINGVTVSTDSRVAVITFTAAVGTGSSAVTLSSADAYDSSGNLIVMSLGNANVNFTTPAATGGGNGNGGGSSGGGSGGGAGGGSGGGNSGSSPGGGKGKPIPPSTTTTTNTANTGTQPTVSDQNIQFTQAVITTTTTNPTQVYIRYGTDKSLSQQTPTSDFATSHQVSLNAVGLVPGQTYYYVIVSKDQAGAVSQTEVQSFTTKGLTVTIGVYDKNHKPIANKTVTLHSTPYTVKTNAKGQATFSNITPGTHHIIYAAGKKSYDEQVAVVNNVRTVGSTQTAPIQNVSVVYGLTQNSSAKTVGVTVTLLLVLVAGVVAISMLRNKVRLASPGGVPLTNEPVIVGGKSTASEPRGPARDIAAPADVTPLPPTTTIKVQGTADQLSAIPDASPPQPGSMVTPKDDAPTTINVSTDDDEKGL